MCAVACLQRQQFLRPLGLFMLHSDVDDPSPNETIFTRPRYIEPEADTVLSYSLITLELRNETEEVYSVSVQAFTCVQPIGEKLYKINVHVDPRSSRRALNNN